MKSNKIVIFLAGILIFICLSLVPSNSFSQEETPQNIEKAAIMIDGKPLFTVGSFNNFTPSQRAELINEVLKEEIYSEESVNLKVFSDNDNAVIRNKLNLKHILTVTKNDVIFGTNTLEQANVWRNILQEQIVKAKSQHTPNYIIRHILLTIFAIIGAILFNILVKFLANKYEPKVEQALKDPNSIIYNLETPVKILWYLTIFSLQIGIWLVITYCITEVFPLARQWRYQLYTIFDANIFVLGKTQYSALDLLILLVLTVGLWMIIRYLTILFKKSILSKTGADRGLQDVIAIIAQYVVTFFGLIILWQIWGFDVSSLAIIVSVLGVGIGFGLQNIANNFISGLIITIERPIQVGHLIKVGDLMGKVKRIGARSTVITTLDQISIIIPNSRFLENEVINWNYDDPISRIHIPVGIAYGSSIKKVRIALLEAVKSHPDVMLTPRPQVWFQKFDDSALNFEVLVWIAEPTKQFLIRSELNYRIAASLEHYNIEIPFPQRDVNLRSPQLEALMKLWLNKQEFSDSSIETTAINQEKISEEMDFISEEEETEKFLNYIEDELDEGQLDLLVEAIRGKEGIEIKNRRYHLTIYSSCFVGKELVDWLVKHCMYTRPEATELGQILIERKVIHHVTDQHPFRDDYLFYRFYVDE